MPTIKDSESILQGIRSGELRMVRQERYEGSSEPGGREPALPARRAWEWDGRTEGINRKWSSSEDVGRALLESRDRSLWTLDPKEVEFVAREILLETLTWKQVHSLCRRARQWLRRAHKLDSGVADLSRHPAEMPEMALIVAEIETGIRWSR